MSLSRRMKSFVRRRIGRVAIFLPPDRGPAPWRWLIAKVRVIEAELLLRRAHDYDGAERTVRPVLDNSQVAGRAWAVMAGVQEHRGNLTGALDAARRATSLEPVRLEALVEHHLSLIHI